MTCDEIRELLELYGIGVLEAEEHIEISRHLAGGCEVCNRNLRTAISLNAGILITAPEAQASPGLRNRVIGTIRPQAPRRQAGWMAVAAGLAIGAVWFGVDSRNKGLQLAETRIERDQSEREAQRLSAAFSFLRDPQTRPASARPNANQPRGSYFISPKGVLLIASSLPVLPAGRIYAMWVIPKGEAPRPAGLFRTDSSGGAVHFNAAPVDVAGAQAVAISVEPEAGSPAPTTTPLLVTPVTGG